MTLFLFCRQLERLTVEQPDKKVGLVVFSSDVIVMGDCSRPPTIVSSHDDLNDLQKLLQVGETTTKNMNLKPISETYE